MQNGESSNFSVCVGVVVRDHFVRATIENCLKVACNSILHSIENEKWTDGKIKLFAD